MDVIQSFKQAAKELQQDERFIRLEATRTANDNDTALQDLIGEFNLVRMDVNNEVEKEERDDERIAQLNTRVNELYGAIMSNPNMVAYNEAKQEIQGLMNYIDLIINTAVDGEDPMAVQEPSSGCGEGGCASCAGCG